MRNYLPATSKSKIQKRSQSIAEWATKHHWQLLVAVLVISAGSIFWWAKYARATIFVGNCTTNYGQEADGSTTQWDHAGFHYVVRSFSLNDTNDAGLAYGYLLSSQSCSQVNWAAGLPANRELVDTNNPNLEWNGQRAVSIQLGVPNQGTDNNFGIWDTSDLKNKTLGVSSASRPPQYDRNWGSEAAFTDDAGLAGIESPRYGIKHSIWCWRLGDDGGTPFNPNPRISSDGYQSCAPWAFWQDPSSFPDTDSRVNGAGWLFTNANCHFSDTTHLAGAGVVFPPGGVTGVDDNHDYNLTGQDMYPGGGQAVQCSDKTNNVWYDQSAINPPNITATLMNDHAHQLFGDANNMDLSNFIGCNGGAGCNGITDRVDPFILRQYAQNTASHTAGALTILTFKYPIPSAVTLTKTDNATLDGLSSYAAPGQSFQFHIAVKKPSSQSPEVSSLTVTDNVPSQFTVTGFCDSFGGTRVGNNVTWFLSGPVIDNLNNNATLDLCLNVTAGATGGTFINHTNGSGTTKSGAPLTVIPGADAVTIINPVAPYLITNGGDVHAGGGIIGVGFQVNCPNPGGNITGQAQSKGDYVVSAEGSITNFGSNGNPTDGSLKSHSYFGICRPNMMNLFNGVGNTNSYTALHSINSGKYPMFNASGDLTIALNFANAAAGPNGMVVNCTGSCSIDNAVTIKRRVTLVAQGGLTIKASVSVAPPNGTTSPNLLGSFGVITDGDIKIKSNVVFLNGFFFANGNVDTCYDQGPATFIKNCKNPLVVTGLFSASDFRFARSGNPPSPSEIISLPGLLLAAPPPIFDGNVSVINGLAGQQEAPPQF